MFVHFIHTNDLHSHFEGLTKQSHFIEARKQELKKLGEPILLIDLGDHMDRAHPLTEGTSGRGNVDLLNAMKYDMVTIGNNEGITFTKEDLERAFEQKEYPVILANLFDQDGRIPGWCEPTYIREIEGYKIGFIGVTANFTDFYKELGWEIKDPMIVLKDLIPDFREQVDCLVILSHVGSSFDQRLANEIKGIDLILGSHTHDVFPEGLVENETLITQAGKFGRFVGEVTLEIGSENQLISKKAVVHNVQEGWEDPVISARVEANESLGYKKLSEVLLTLHSDLLINWDEPTLFSSLLAEGLKEWCQADIGMINSGVLLGDLVKGPVSKGELHRLCPHPLNPCRVTLKGKDVLDLIPLGEDPEFKNWALLGFGFRGKRLGGLVFSGLRYKKAQNKAGWEATVNGTPIDENRIYSIGTTDMFTLGKVAPPIRRSNETKLFMPEFLRDVLAWKLQKESHNL